MITAVYFFVFSQLTKSGGLLLVLQAVLSIV